MNKTDRQSWENEVAALELYPLIRPYFEQGLLPVRSCAAGTCISDAADEGYHILYLLRGSIKVFSLSYRGRRILLDEVGAPSFSGHISRLRGHSFDASLVAQTDCVYLEFSDRLFLKLMQDPPFALEFYRSTSRRTYYMYHKFLGLSLFTAEENTAMYYLLHGDRFRTGTLDSMSEEIGISRRSLCYILKRWQARGILSSRNGRYQVADPPALFKLTEQIRLFYNQLSLEATPTPDNSRPGRP